MYVCIPKYSEEQEEDDDHDNDNDNDYDNDDGHRCSSIGEKKWRRYKERKKKINLN